MFKSLINRLAGLTLSFNERVSQASARWRRDLKTAGLGWPFSKTPARLGLELLVAGALTVNFFYLVKPQCTKKPGGNAYPTFTFSYFAKQISAPAVPMPANWRTRVLAPIASSWFLETAAGDLSLLRQTYPSFTTYALSDNFQNIFAAYHSLWLLLLFLTLIFLRPDALLIILGCFVGLMYNLAEPSGQFYYPWDMPALFFFTLACLLFDRGWIWALLPLVALGGLFKETVLCCAFFILFAGQWTWPRRITAILAAILANVGLNRLLMVHYGITTPLSTLNGAAKFSDLFEHTLLSKNLHLLFSANLNHVLFANAGALFLMMLIPWRNRRDIAFKLAIVAFAAGQFLYGVIDEVRIWYELLPLGWILLSDAFSRPPLTPQQSKSREMRLLRGSYWLSLAGLVIVLLVLFVLVKPESSLAEKPVMLEQPIPADLLASAQKGDVSAQFHLGIFFLNIRHDYTNGWEWLSRSAAQGNAPALYNMGVIRWNGPSTGQDHPDAMRLFRAAAQHGQVDAMRALGKICNGLQGMTPDPIEAYVWYKLAALQQGVQTNEETAACAMVLTPDETAEAEKRVTEFRATIK